MAQELGGAPARRGLGAAASSQPARALVLGTGLRRCGGHPPGGDQESETTLRDENHAEIVATIKYYYHWYFC